MPRRTARRESSVGLIVTLIFFILTSVGLGASTYYGFAQQDDLKKKADAADALREKAEAERNWYQFQALLYRTWLGLTAGFDQPVDPQGDQKDTPETRLGVFRGQYQDGSLGKDLPVGSKNFPQAKDLPDKGVVTELINKVEGSVYLVAPVDKDGKPLPGMVDKDGKLLRDKDGKLLAPPPPVYVSLAWDQKTNRPQTNFEQIYWRLRALIDDRTNTATAALNAVKTAEQKQTDLTAERDDWKQKFDAKQKDLDTKDLTIKDKAFTDLITKVNTELTNATTAKNTADTAKGVAEAALTKAKADTDKANNDLLALKKSVTEQQEVQDQKLLEAPTEGKPIPMDWKIVRMDRSGKQPFINLGTAASVAPGLTFSIHGQGPDGRPLPASKGTLEVLNVVSENLSQAQVVSVKDSFKDPILPGDFLYNPIFHPGRAQHVVIAGRIDMHGTKGDDLKELKDLLNRQNVKVDAYVDPLDGSIKDGRLTVNTDYLVLGDVAELKDGPVKASVDALKEEARRNGVRIVSARDFLESMGYHTP